MCVVGIYVKSCVQPFLHYILMHSHSTCGGALVSAKVQAPWHNFKMDVFSNLMELLPCFRLSWQDWRPDGVTNSNGPLKGWGGRIPALIRWHLIAAQTQGRACTDSVISPAQLMSPAVPKNKI